jgi:acetyl-CoA acetyltransferase
MTTDSHRTFSDAWIPHRAYWTTPFVRWQGSFATAHPVKLAAEVGATALADRGIDPTRFNQIVLGTTVPSRASFFGAPWYGTLIGAPGIGGPMIAQACATSARVLAMAAADVQAGDDAVLGACCDRTSNGPVVYYPNPTGPGGMGETEQWVWDNFNNDPTNGSGGIEMAERLAAEAGIERKQQDELTALRYEQYYSGTEGGLEFRRRYMVTPVEVKNASGKRVIATVADDEGVENQTFEKLEAMRTVFPEGTVTGGTQTHPADGSCGIAVTNRAIAEEWGKGGPATQVVAFGQARARTGFLGESTVVSAAAALKAAGLSMSDMTVVKTHNPFAVHDLYFAQQFDLPWERFGNHGSSLVYGHPNGATGMRGIMEVIEELVDSGGGYGLFSGCAAGDTGGAVIVKVDA